MTALARREQFLFGGADLAFYWIENINCMIKFIGKDEISKDAVVMFSR
jgi:hypothetical protein